jgi:hypothetical protein
MTYLEKGAERTPSTLVREGIGKVTVVKAIKEVVEREGEDAVAILPTSAGEEVGESRSSETLEPGRYGSGCDLPFLGGTSEGTGEEGIALAVWLAMTTLSAVCETGGLATEVGTEVVT